MEPIDSSESNAIGWHLIARGGDMTARVHPAMRLGVLSSGDISFEAPDAVVQLDLAGEALSLAVVADDYELELESGERTIYPIHLPGFAEVQRALPRHRMHAHNGLTLGLLVRLENLRLLPYPHRWL